MKYILASASPRRKDILEALGLSFDILTADTDENSTEQDAELLAQSLAQKKGMAVYDKLRREGMDLSDTVIISADTVVVCNGEILGKPRDPADARRMLCMLSDNEHEVVSGIAITYQGITHTDRSVTYVCFDPLSEEEMERYLDSDEPYDKAGAYGIQGHASLWVKEIRGSYFGVVGLPVRCLNQLHYRLFHKPLV